MKYNPITQTLFSDEGAYVKKLYCPLSKQWSELKQGGDASSRGCDHCRKEVHDTAFLTDSELLHLLEQDLQACLKVDLNQANLIVTYE